MAAVTAAVDGRAQYSLAAVAMANHSLGRWPFAGVQEIFPGRYGLEERGGADVRPDFNWDKRQGAVMGYR